MFSHFICTNWCINSMSFKSESIGKQNCIELWGFRQTYDERLIKRLFDLVIFSFRFCFNFPIICFNFYFSKLSSRGPIFFKQKRCGMQGKVFNCYKFRSMYVEATVQDSPLKQAQKGDKRITFVGDYYVVGVWMNYHNS